MQTACPAPVSHQGLTRNDCSIIAACGTQLPGGWSVRFDRFADSELFARLLAPGSDDDNSAFLIERQPTGVILTDRLSNHIKDHCSIHASAEEAVLAVRLVLSALSEALCAACVH
jgi:hypothetical protein